MQQIEYLNNIFSHVCIYLLCVVSCHTIDLIALQDTLIKHLAQARIDPVLLQQKAYLYYKELQLLHRKIKYNDSNAICKIKQIINRGELYLDARPLENNEWSSFELTVLDDIINATKDVLNKCMTSIAHLDKNIRTSLECDSFELRSEQEQNIQSQFENTCNDLPKEQETNIENLLHEIVNKKQSDEFNNETFNIKTSYWKNGKKILLDGEMLRQVNIEKLKRRIKHEEMKTVANIKKAEKQRKHLERMKQRQVMKERKARRMEKHRLLTNQLEKKQSVIK